MSTSEIEEKKKSDWSALDLASKVLRAWESIGGTRADINYLAEHLDVLRDIVGILRGTHVVTRKAFPTWRTVRRGVYRSLDAYLAAAEVKGHKIGTYASQILAKIAWAQEEIVDELVLASGRDLGLADGYTVADGDVAAATFGLYPCEAEAAVAFRDQYLDQPLNEWLPFAMKAVADSDLSLQVFYVARDSGGLWLLANYEDADFRYAADTVRVWSRRPPVSAPAASV
ncbi:MAG: hypothetical protein WCO25_04455 [Candidatus Uhrbacteria bacterium]